jgi:cyclophilin family peptidyl-prolyl cis-trans isomerase
MRRSLISLALVATFFCLDNTLTLVQGQGAKPAASGAPIVVLETVKGVIEIETFPTEAPKSVAHFVDLARKGFYRGQRFHWVQPGVIQGGDPLSRDLTKQKEWGTGGSGVRLANKPIGVAEPSKRKFERGIVGLAYRPGWKPETADSMFFILTGPNPALNGKYAALGKVIKGIEVADKIQATDAIKNVTVR